jgi:Plant transposon protein
VLLPTGAAVRYFRTGNLGKPVLCKAEALCFAAMQPNFCSDDSALSSIESSPGSHEDLVVQCSAVAAAHHYWNTIEKENDAQASRCTGGSRPGKGRNRNRGRAEGAFRIERDYFCMLSENAGNPDGPVFINSEFRLRFRVSRNIYERVRASLLAWDDMLFVERADARGVMSATTDQKISVFFKALATGASAEDLVDYGRLATSTDLLCLKKFCAGVVDLFEKDWLRLPNEDDLKRLAHGYAEPGFPGCMGAVDFASWYWDVCPISWQGQCRKSNNPNVRMEVICDDFILVYWLNFGAPGGRSNEQIMNQINFFNDLRTGQWPPACPEVDICGFKLKWFYVLADGIHPSVSYLMSSISSPRTLIENLHAKQ